MTTPPGQLELLEGAKQKAREAGLWNFFLPNAKIGEGLSNLDYAYIAAELAKSPLASETLNCSAPDTGNMEVLERIGTPERKEECFKPLLRGEIRSAFAVTQPDMASSEKEEIPLRRLGEPEDFAGIAVYLTSDASKYTTGQALTVCGGSNMWT